MGHYRSNLRDIAFNLFEAYRTQENYGQGAFAQMDEETARVILAEIDRLARNEWSASFAEADRTPLRLVDGEVALGEGLKRSLDAYYDGGWHLLPLPPRLGGHGAPPSLRWAASELLLGANPTAFFYTTGPLMASVVDHLGTEEQKRRFVAPMIERRWGATMVLTEPDAGSDVGAGVTRAVHVDRDVYHLQGVKRFITSGEADYFENIVHLVLARAEGAPPGTKGLSMFIVPKYLVGDDGSLGERNGVVCTHLETKMGVKGSTTCDLTLGADRPAVGHLVGDVHDGIRQMFLVIEYARMLIGAKAVGTLSTGYLHALEYAKVRQQGPDMLRTLARSRPAASGEPAPKDAAPKVAIIDHPDVRRMLMLQKAYAEGLRALVLFTGWVQDQAELRPDEDEWLRRDDLLLPMVKGYASERAFELLTLSLQVLGGSGYTCDYPIEQYIRDAKIDTVYEGTTGIQALDLFFRKIVRDRGRTLTWLLEEVRDSAKAGVDGDPFAAERDVLGGALEDVQAHVGAMVGFLMAAAERPDEIYKVGLNTNALLDSLSELVIGWLLLRHAEVASAALADAAEPDRSFYAGKIASARFWARTVLPQVGLRRHQAETTDLALMELPATAF
ncbi:MAG TPA: acyl-CoA dehydrogenase [Nitriliruptorales bacterium]|nr:acyl-CoA dehydrogenase [Nitriliruptorales bacterium]